MLPAAAQFPLLYSLIFIFNKQYPQHLASIYSFYVWLNHYDMYL